MFRNSAKAAVLSIADSYHRVKKKPPTLFKYNSYYYLSCVNY